MSANRAHAVTLVKFGGSIITDKSIPNSVRTKVLRRLIQELKAGLDAGRTLVLAHGSGSFGHVPASRYRTKEGFVDQDSRLGMAITQDSAAQLNRIVVHECLKQDVAAVSVYISNSLVLNNGSVQSHYDEVFREYLKKGLLPVTSGDVIVDTVKGCGIWSADTILPFFAQQFQTAGWSVDQIVHVTSTPGVYRDVEHPEQGIFELITSENQTEVQSAMGATKGFDVTGGMWTKISECLQLAQTTGIESVILSGNEPGTLERHLRGENVTATWIRA